MENNGKNCFPGVFQLKREDAVAGANTSTLSAALLQRPWPFYQYGLLLSIFSQPTTEAGVKKPWKLLFGCFQDQFLRFSDPGQELIIQLFPIE